VRLLLDTHIVLWWLSDSPRLAKSSKKLIARNAEVFVSAATAWEIAIKKSLGKLQAPDDLEAALAANRFRELPIAVRHALAAGELSRHHEDPFDRLLVAQAQMENLTLLTSDERLQAYEVPVILNTR
jgi:PIN domain nuclease of toxin-antitoxin system